MTIQLEVVPEDEQAADIADIDEVGRSLVDQLRSSKYTVTPVYTGKKGGEPVFDILMQVPQFLHNNKDLLLEIFDSISLVLQCVLIARDRRTEREKAQRDPLKITFEADGKPVTIETSDADSGAKLLEKLRTAHPEAVKKITPQSSAKIKASVPPKRKRQRPH